MTIATPKRRSHHCAHRTTVNSCEFEVARATAPLPPEPNAAAANELLIALHRRFLRLEDRDASATAAA
jgi:hypothetical protein